MLLADTSAWIEYLRATGSVCHERLRVAIEHGDPIATMGTVLMEVLAGAADERHANQLTRLLSSCATYVPLEEPNDHEAAAALYRAGRTGGVTVRRSADCLIAAVAIRVRATVLHRDADFDAIAQNSPLVVTSG
ncbi:MAG: PIN domain nuclease [Thermoleophilaceae bacterium]|nr:PIN domain nuclease [Thermoleophilaceae bacterium]